MELTKKVALITGASRGIGEAAANKFLSEGWVVIGTSTDGAGWEHNNLSWLKLDLADPGSIDGVTRSIKEAGPVDVLINNGGVWPDEEEEEGAVISIPVLRRTLETNLIGTIDLTERMLDDSLIKPGGRIISMGSMSGVIGDKKVGSMVPSYKISKVGLSMYSRTLAARLQDKFIVSILDPGWVKTDMGGDEAPRSPEEPATELYDLSTKDIPTGKFWREGKERSW